MKKGEQKKYIVEALEILKENDLPISWLLKRAKISRTHWYFLKKGDRPLTMDKAQKINSILFSIPTTKY